MMLRHQGRFEMRRGCVCLLTRLIGLGLLLLSGCADSRESNAMHRMLQEIDNDFARTFEYTGIRTMSATVRGAIERTPRHRYVKDSDQSRAYVNRPLSIGHGQTISQPYIVALMTELAMIGPQDSVLEIGTGSGYQAAILGLLAKSVKTIELIPELSAVAAGRIAEAGLSNVECRVGDGNLGWPEAAPFDAIVVTAGGVLPPALVEQLAPNGRIVIPLNVVGGDQMLTVIAKDANGDIERTDVLPVRFVPLVRTPASLDN